VRWDSAGVDWPASAPIVSTRDAGFAPLSEFVSPFVFDPS
jgi:dTDP-4-dehydrorhamnose 3,5-epimerase